MSQPKAYVCGPMTGYPAGNRRAFEAAAAYLRNETPWTVLCPLEMNTPAQEAEALADEYGPVYWELLASDIQALQTVAVLCLLPGWEKSKGARLEVFVGLLMDKTFYTFDGADLCFWGRSLVRERLKENMP